MNTIVKNKNKVLVIAKDVFLKKGIADVSMTDIAEEAQFGVASIYRYFGNKNALVVECAVSLWEERIEKIRKEYQKNSGFSGFEQLKRLTDFFPWLIVGDKDFSRFLIMFDAFLYGDNITAKERADYERAMLEIYRMFEAAYNSGLADGTVRNIGSFSDFYFACTQSLLSLSQKLTIRGNVLSGDKEHTEKIEMLIDMYTDYIRAK